MKTQRPTEEPIKVLVYVRNVAIPQDKRNLKQGILGIASSMTGCREFANIKIIYIFHISSGKIGSSKGVNSTTCITVDRHSHVLTLKNPSARASLYAGTEKDKGKYKYVNELCLLTISFYLSFIKEIRFR